MEGISGSEGHRGFKLEPTHAAIFSLEVIFAISTFIQGIVACWNFRRRALKHPPSIVTPEFDLGSIFPSCLLLSTMLLTALHLLRVVMVGMENNIRNPNPQRFSIAYNQAVLAMEFTGETVLLAGLLILVVYRKKMTLKWKAWKEKKTVLDMGLIVVLFALSFARVFIISSTSESANTKILQNLAITYSAVYFIGAIDLFITSFSLFGRSRQNESWDLRGDSILQHIALPVAFLLVCESLVSLVIDVIGRGVMAFNVVDIVVKGVTQLIVITFCLRFGIPKGSEGVDFDDMDMSVKGTEQDVMSQ